MTDSVDNWPAQPAKFRTGPARARFDWISFAMWMFIFSFAIIGAYILDQNRAFGAQPDGSPVNLAARVMIESGLSQQVKFARQSVTAPGDALTLDGGATVVNPTREPMRVLIDGDSVTLAPYGIVVVHESPAMCAVECGTDCAECWVYYGQSPSLKEGRWYCGTACHPSIPGVPCAHDCTIVYTPSAPGPADSAAR